MKRNKGKKLKTAGNISKKVRGKVKKATKSAKKKTSAVKGKARKMFSSARKRLDKIKNRSSKALLHAKDKVYATEEDVLKYVKENPVKSASALALAGLIAGFISKFKKRK